MLRPPRTGTRRLTAAEGMQQEVSLMVPGGWWARADHIEEGRALIFKHWFSSGSWLAAAG